MKDAVFGHAVFEGQRQQQFPKLSPERPSAVQKQVFRQLLRDGGTAADAVFIGGGLDGFLNGFQVVAGVAWRRLGDETGSRGRGEVALRPR